MTREAVSSSAALFLVAILLAGAALRVPHLRGPIDEPHGWRQAETAQYARSFWQGRLDVMHPSVCWLGAHRTLALEFPLPEAVTSVVYRMLGREELMVPRILSLLCYLGACVYLFRILALLFDAEAGAYAAIVFLVLPLGLYYSRAVHADPAVLLCAHAALFYAMAFYEDGGWVRALAASLWATAGFAMKAPYLFYLAVPMIALMATRIDWRRALVLVAAAVPPVVVFLLWRKHVEVVNAGAPDWSFIPGFHTDFAKHLSGGGAWFYGTLEQRLDPKTWHVLAWRVWREIAGPIGVMLVALALATTPAAARRFGTRPVLVLWAWGLGALGYVLVFYNLNVIHSYYQLPLVAVVAMFVALGLATFRREWSDLVPWVSSFAVAGALALLTVHSLVLARGRYYQADEPRAQAAAIIRSQTAPNALIVTAISHDDRTDDPRLLYRASRYGWSMGVTAVDTALVTRMRQLGATDLAVLLDGPPPQALIGVVARHPAATSFELPAKPWRLLLVPLGARHGG